jgi:hypothetical protein
VEVLRALAATLSGNDNGGARVLSSVAEVLNASTRELRAFNEGKG